ncbi:MAG: 30S ribosomal protein S7 [Planctomycetota bacterium]|jgi:small subunit ribosomal protein S7
MSEEQVQADEAKVEENVQDEAAIPADVKRNEDGSITIAESGEESAAVSKPQSRVGRGIFPDAKYGSEQIAKFINCIMLDGKKSTAEKIVYDALEQIAGKLKVDPLKVFEQAIDNAKPMVEVRSKRVGGANYQVPVQVKAKRQQTLAFRWILEAVRGRKGRPTAEKLAQELIDCYNKTGSTIQKRENVHRMADANKAFSHFA